MISKIENNNWKRRQFVSTMAAATLAFAFDMFPKISFAGFADDDITIQQIIDRFIASIPAAPFSQTVDGVKSGDASQKVKGIVTTMFATIDIIGQAASIGANFIIAHEPTFFTGNDATDWLTDNELYKYKHGLLEKHNIVVWRCHDYLHKHVPDGVLMETLKTLGWDRYYNAQNPHVLNIPENSLENIIHYTKSKLNISHARFVGKLSQSCKKIALLPGHVGGIPQMQAIDKEKPDLLIVGEVHEWETSEYVRDLQRMDGATSLLVLGHIASEEPGMQWLKQWLDTTFPQIKTIHIPNTEVFSWA
ncbi:MAG: Nif3-like dinuclear metal center hexameric protein [Chitinophagaceae bacterium]